MRIGLLGIALYLLSANSTLAARPPTALQLLNEGIAHYRAGELDVARVLFERALELAPDKPNPYRWLGLVDARLGRCADAVPKLDEFLKRIPNGDQRAPESKAARDRCKEELAPKHGTLVVESTPPGAEVRIDDEAAAPVGATPYRNESMVVGPHVVFVSKEGFQKSTKGFAVARDDTVKIDVELRSNAPLVIAPELPTTTETTAPATLPLTSTTPLEPARREPRGKIFWIVGAVGLAVIAGLTVGLVLGLMHSNDTSMPANALPPIAAETVLPPLMGGGAM